MEWNLKTPLQWDWENLAFFSGKESEISDWRFENGEMIKNGPVYSSGSGTCCSSDLRNSSSRSLISASVGSSLKVGVKMSELNFESVEGYCENLNNNKLISGEDTENSSVVVGSSSSGEPPIGLKLGKRTYFDDFIGVNTKASGYLTSIEKPRASHQATQNSHCQVEGCNIDLIAAKDYHRKHRVCESHSKSPKVIVAGHERRFCQQCSRFHDLSEFDQKKRSCRRRLSDHNARRRKPQLETISFSSRFSPSFYDGGHQLNFCLNRAPFSHTSSSAGSLWEDCPGFSLSTIVGSWFKTNKAEGVAAQLQPHILDFSNSVHDTHPDLDRPMLSKSSTNAFLNEGLQASISASMSNRASDVRCALSLLSNESCCPPSVGQSNMIHFTSSDQTAVSNPPFLMVNSVSECWQDEHFVAQEPLTFNSHVSHFFEFSEVDSKSGGNFLEFQT